MKRAKPTTVLGASAEVCRAWHQLAAAIAESWRWSAGADYFRRRAAYAATRRDEYERVAP